MNGKVSRARKPKNESKVLAVNKAPDKLREPEPSDFQSFGC